jgi:CxxC-x17-CxxC domain-containing protein
MNFEDMTLQCSDCGCEFVFTAKEQEFYQEKGFGNPPKRCKICRENRKRESSHGRRDFPQKRLYNAICAGCGCETQVPFQPTGDRPVYCRECYNQMKRNY